MACGGCASSNCFVVVAEVIEAVAAIEVVEAVLGGVVVVIVAALVAVIVAVAAVVGLAVVVASYGAWQFSINLLSSQYRYFAGLCHCMNSCSRIHFPVLC